MGEAKQQLQQPNEKKKRRLRQRETMASRCLCSIALRSDARMLFWVSHSPIQLHQQVVAPCVLTLVAFSFHSPPSDATIVQWT